MNPDTTNVIYSLLGGTFLIALVAIIGGFLHYRRERYLSHQERMKALDLGREMPDHAATARIKAAFGTLSGGDKEEESGSLSRKCYSTALWVAFWGFLAASQGGWVNHAIAIAIASSAGAIGVTGMICGTILAVRSPAEAAHRPVSKPAIEADALC
ncbi:MAG: hypothetical protein ACHRXM_25655 [Isosphaerales bacterium]